MKLRPETLTAAAATLTAVAALGIAVWDNVQTREHNRLSVVPHLTVDQSVQGPLVLLTVRNDGVGPAIVESVQIHFTESGQQRTTQVWSDVAPLFRDAGHSIAGSWQFSSGDAIGVGRSVNLLQVRSGEGVDLTVSAGDLVDSIMIEIEYRSIYGDELFSTWDAPQ